ncbi:MAG: IS200/IS605 family transposase [Lentisphaeria bacterium]|jgi:REP element-mobilizing transposase RayT|nr:IS200/IS605 family transposase [Lentisphaeria bacterium]
MPQSLANNLIHLVFSTKHREQWLVDAVRPALHAYLTTVFKNLQCPVLTLNSVEDHIHILFALHRTVALSAVVEDAKKTSSKWLKTQGADLATFAWQGGYGAFSVSESNVADVRQYIARQAEHHRKISFQDELRAFLTKHKLHFDERYLWD